MSDDKRPRIYGLANTTYGQIEVTVVGSEGETSADLEDRFDERVDKLAATQRELANANRDDKRGAQ